MTTQSSTSFVPTRTRITWVRWDHDAGRTRISHPYVWEVSDETGYVRTFDTKREALAWIAEYTS